MEKLIVHSTLTAEWQALISEAEAACNTNLGEEVESYLVFLLIRFMQHAELAGGNAIGLDFLNCLQYSEYNSAALRDVGDKCLLFSGLFPERALHRNVTVSYFVDVGRAAYHILSEMKQKSLANLYADVCASFVPMMDVLQTTRVLYGDEMELPLLLLDF